MRSNVPDAPGSGAYARPVPDRHPSCSTPLDVLIDALATLLLPQLGA
jgi:hypothetical protein